MRRLVATIVIIPLVVGCSHVQHIDPTASEDHIAEVNQRVRGRTVTVQLVDLTEFKARDVVVAADSTRMVLLAPTRRSTTLSNSSIRTLAVTNRADGALRGLGMGFLVGAAAGAVIGAATVDDNYAAPGDPMSTSESVGTGIALLGTLGAVSGLVLGAVFGEREVYRFTELGIVTPDTPNGDASEGETGKSRR